MLSKLLKFPKDIQISKSWKKVIETFKISNYIEISIVLETLNRCLEIKNRMSIKLGKI